MRPSFRFESRAPGVLFDVAVLLFLVAVVARHFNVTVERYYSFGIIWPEDQAMFNHLLWNLSHRLSWENTVLFHINFLSAHFSPVYLPLSLIYRLWPSPETAWLMVDAGLAAGMFLLYRISAVRLDTRLGAFACIVLLVSHPVTTSNMLVNGFRDTTVAVCFLCLALWAYERERFGLFGAGFILAAMCKEDMPFIGIGFSLLALLHGRTRRWRLFPVCFGLAYVAVAFAAMHGLGSTWQQNDLGKFNYLGHSSFETAQTLLLRPGVWIAQITSQHKVGAMRQLFAPFGFLSLLGPEYLIVPGSQFAEVLLAAPGYIPDLRYWYVLPVVPFVFYAAVVGVSRIMRVVVVGLRSAVRISGTLSSLLTPARIGLLVGTAASLSLAACAWRPLLTQVEAFGGLRHWIIFNQDDARRTAVDSLLARVPPDAPVCAQVPYTLAFSTRAYVYSIPACKEENYVVINRKASRWPSSDIQYAALLERLANESEFSLVHQTGDIELYARLVSEEP